MGLNNVHCWKSVKIRGIPKVTGYLFMLPKKFPHRPLLYDLLDKAELRVLPPPCMEDQVQSAEEA